MIVLDDQISYDLILAGIASSVRYDNDRRRKQDPASVFASRRAHCVGLAELAVDLLRRLGISARTVQGVLRAKPGTDGYDSRVLNGMMGFLEGCSPRPRGMPR